MLVPVKVTHLTNQLLGSMSGEDAQELLRYFVDVPRRSHLMSSQGVKTVELTATLAQLAGILRAAQSKGETPTVYWPVAGLMQHTITAPYHDMGSVLDEGEGLFSKLKWVNME